MGGSGCPLQLPVLLDRHCHVADKSTEEEVSDFALAHRDVQHIERLEPSSWAISQYGSLLPQGYEFVDIPEKDFVIYKEMYEMPVGIAYELIHRIVQMDFHIIENFP